MRIAIIGCGQLARMLALTGWPMGFSFSFLARPEESDCSVRGLGDVVRIEPGMDAGAIYAALGKPAVVTIEREDAPVSLLQDLRQYCPVYPDPGIVAICQHRAKEKQYLIEQGVKTAPYRHIKDLSQLPAALAALGTDVIIKSCESGYDGRNQWRLGSPERVARFLAEHSWLPESIVEQRIPFARELSVIVARSAAGQVATYPPSENQHQDGILLSSVAPAPGLTAAIEDQLQTLVSRILSGWNYVGVLAIECFQAGADILVNEMAPRVHNSGHWTQMGATCSQFENHLRAITGLGLGSTASKGHAGMVNLLGCELPANLAGLPNTQVHLYNKALRARRKMGHLNLMSDTPAARDQQLEHLTQAIYQVGTPIT